MVKWGIGLAVVGGFLLWSFIGSILEPIGRVPDGLTVEEHNKAYEAKKWYKRVNKVGIGMIFFAASLLTAGIVTIISGWGS